MEELKPCPFCGDLEPIVEYDDGWDVTCSKCSAQSPSCLGLECDDRELAIKRWNTRSKETT